MNIPELQKKAHENAKSKGFWDDVLLLEGALDLGEYETRGKEFRMYRNNAYACRLALIHTEVSEATEALREGDMVNFAEELADIVIRVFDFAGGLEIDLEKEILTKMDKNESRPPRHGKAF